MVRVTGDRYGSSENKAWFSFVDLEEKAAKWRELSRVAAQIGRAHV